MQKKAEKKINIAIDGYSSTGKSTLARDLARDLGYRYIDTGAMYRAVTLWALRKGWLLNGQVNPELNGQLDQVHIEFTSPQRGTAATLLLNHEEVEEALRTPEVAEYVSEVARLSPVRRFLVKQQQAMARQKGVVMDGRDIGTVVLPDAELKLFMTAEPEVRVERRFQELAAKGVLIDRQEVRENLRKRDRIDSNRRDSPLKQATDARILDNSEMSQSEQLALVKQWVKAVLEA